MNKATEKAILRALPELYIICRVPMPKKLRRALLFTTILRHHPNKDDFTYEDLRDAMNAVVQN